MDKVKETLNKVPLSGYIVLVIAIAQFSPVCLQMPVMV